MKLRITFLWFITYYLNLVLSKYAVKLSSNDPVIVGGTVNFTAELTDDGNIPDGYFRFEWEDDAIPSHTKTMEGYSTSVNWSVSYTNNPPGFYKVQVVVKKQYIIPFVTVTSERMYFELTDSLNGVLNLNQKNKTINSYVSNSEPTVHNISIKETDFDFINKTYNAIYTYWFINCNFEGITNNYEFVHNYTELGIYHVEALVVAKYEPPVPSSTLPPTTTTAATTTTITTSTTSSTTSSTSSTTSSTSSTTSSPLSFTSDIYSTTSKAGLLNYSPIKFLSINSTNMSLFGLHNSSSLRGTPEELAHLDQSPEDQGSLTVTGLKRKRHVEGLQDPKNVTFLFNKLVAGQVKFNSSFPMICNSTLIPFGLNYTYGYFPKEITVKAPISSLAVTGNNWLQQGNVLELQVKCGGSEIFSHCIIFYSGTYNVTGNETCANPIKNDTCLFGIRRYYGSPGVHTIVVIVSNDVSHVISPVVVTVYEVKKQAQLSVIVVPVSFTIIAVVLIVFGVAYYIQNRTRFTIEVADFNFGPQSMEYMTFKERLRDSIVNAFTRANVETESEETENGPIWPPSRKYGSMT